MKCAKCGRQMTYRQFSPSEGANKRDPIELRSCVCREHKASVCIECCQPSTPGKKGKRE